MLNVAKAIRSNSVYAKQLRWIDQYSRILTGLGFSAPPSIAPEFARAVANWQSKNSLKDDGMLGPFTWRKLRSHLNTQSLLVSAPPWLLMQPIDEGWFDSILDTLRRDTGFLRLSYRSHIIAPADFRQLADLIEGGDILIEVIDGRQGSYEFRNSEHDANTLKVPRRSKHHWRVAQALILHEACHAISDVKGAPVPFIDEEAFAYVVQAMYSVRWDVQRDLRNRRPETLLIFDTARTVGTQCLAMGSARESDWDNLRSAIRSHSAYSDRAMQFATLEFDGV